MKKLEQDDYEYVFSNSSEIFEIQSPRKFTWQKLYFSSLCMETFYGVGFLSEQIVDSFKEKYLLWQNKRIPSFEWVNKAEMCENGTIQDFSHSDDLKWDDIQSPMIKYIMLNTIAIGCDTYQDFLRKEFLGDEE